MFLLISLYTVFSLEYSGENIPVVIERWECKSLARSNRWLLVYGRRKTGKTFLLRRCVNWSMYVTITKTRTCIVEHGGEVEFQNLDACLRKALNKLTEGNVVVIDEFQRLPEEYWDLIGLKHHEASGKLILCGSSLGVARKVFDRRSPLLGLLEPFLVDIASPEDTILSLVKHLKPREAILWATVARDPWILGIITPHGSPWRTILDKATSLAPISVSLVGEVFTEEEKQLTRLYEAVLKLLAQRYWSSKMLAQKLYEAHLISSPQLGIVTGLLSQLEAMGLVEKIPLWKTRGSRYYYKHRSPLLSVLLRIEELVEEHGIKPNPQTLMYDLALETQFTLGELMAKHHRLNRAYTILPYGQGDIDIVLLNKNKKPIIAYEVKIGEITKSEARKTVEKIREHGIPKAGLISLTEKPPEEKVDESLGPQEIVAIAEKLKKQEKQFPH